MKPATSKPVAQHALKFEALAMRRNILGVSPSIRKGIKWSSSYLAPAVLHDARSARQGRRAVRLADPAHGGQAPPGAKRNLRVADPTGMPEWLAEGRCLVNSVDWRGVQAMRAAHWNILRQWIRWT